MSDQRDLSRREFMILAAAMTTPLVPWSSVLERWSRPTSAPPDVRLAGLLRSGASARVIGAAYLEAEPAEADAHRLVDAIVIGLEGGDVALRAEPAELRRRLLNRIAQDFSQEATVSLRGWIVSRTEARLCALAKLRLG